MFVLLVIPIPQENPHPAPSVKMTGSNRGQIHGYGGSKDSGSRFHAGKAAFARGSEELLPLLQPTGFLQNLPFTCKFLPSEDCWLWLACQRWQETQRFCIIPYTLHKEKERGLFCAGYCNQPAACRESLCKGWERGSKYRKRKLDLLTLIPNNQFSAERRTTNLKFPCLGVTT